MEERPEWRDEHGLKEEEEEHTGGKFCKVSEGGVANQGENDSSVDNPVGKVGGLITTSPMGGSRGGQGPVAAPMVKTRLRQ
jgi:hypothetical protein